MKSDNSENKQLNSIKRKSNGKRGNQKSRGKIAHHANPNPKTKDEDRFKISDRDINDSTYYYTDGLLRDQITNYSFNQFLGVPFEAGKRYTNSSLAHVKKQADIATIMSIEVNPALETEAMFPYGLQAYSNSGISKAGLKNFYILSANNAKTTNYQPNDVSMLIIALAELTSLVSHIRRVFGVQYKYSVRNRDLPQQLTQIMGVNSSDLKDNMANYRIRFNTILNTMNRLPIPGNIALITKDAAMYNNIYLDDPVSSMAQVYVMKPYSTWIFNELKSDTGSGFDTYVLGDYENPKTMGEWLDVLEAAYTAIIQSSTFNFIFSDILRLTEKGTFGILRFELLPDMYDAPILYSDEMNLWINNMRILNVPNGSSQDVITNVATDYIEYNPVFNFQPNYITNIANFTKGDDTESRIAATRLMGNYTYEQGVDSCSAIVSDHYVCKLGILCLDTVNNARRMFYAGQIFTTVSEIQGVFLCALTKFTSAPRLYIIADNDEYGVSIHGDLNYWTQITDEQLRTMFDAEWLGLMEMR